MLRKWNRVLSFILAIALIATTFNSDINTIRVFADGDIVENVDDAEPAEPVVEEQVEEPVVEEPVVEEPVVEEPAEPEVIVEEPEVTPDEGEPNPEDPENQEIQDEEPIEGEDVEVEPEEEKELTEEELAELAEKEAKEKAEKEAAEKEAQKKMVTVSYKASLGGRVSNSGETIDINDEEAKFEGSTASAVNKYYQFVAWVDADGNTVCSDSTFVPSDIEEDATFTANFMKLSEMPAQSFSGSAGGMNVSVEADEGIFPDGTTMNVTAISDDEALEAAKDAVGEAAQTAKGVDITFKNADGEEIEPADARYVHVSISLASELEGDSFSVVHKDDSGNADVIASASADGAEFEANQFSVYIVVGTGDDITDPDTQIVTNTYVFMADGEEFRTEVIKNGEELENPGIPTLGDNQEFKGWFYKEGTVEKPVVFGPKEGITEEKTITCYAKIDTTFYLTFMGVDGEVVQVKSVTVEGEENADIDTTDVHVTPKDADEAHRGWTVTEGSTEIKNIVNAKDYQTVYPVIMKAHWITFNENDGDDHGGASYTGPVSVFTDQKPSQVKPLPPTRKGYEFGGWYKQKADGDGKVVDGTEFDWEAPLTDNITLYAKWTPSDNTEYTVIIWQQKITDKKNVTDNEAKTYDFKTSFTQNGTTGAPISNEIGRSFSDKGDYGFHYSWCKVVRNKGEEEIPVTEIRAKGDTIVNVYFDRDVMTINFYLKENGQWNLKDTYTGLFGQTLAQNDYSWPADHAWYSDVDWWNNASGTRLTFLNAFLFDGLSGASDDKRTLTQYGTDTSGSVSIEFFTQNVNGGWPGTAAYSTKVGTGSFTITDKYNGFKADSYRTKKTKNSNWGGWKNVSDPDGDGEYATVTEEYVGLQIRFARLKYELEFIENYRENLQTVGKIENIPFEDELSNYSKHPDIPKIPETDPSKPGYRFKGWYLDSAGTKEFTWTGTMPAANMVVYGCYEPVRYTVTLETDGGILPEGQDDSFELDYGETVSKTSLMNTTKPGFDLIGWYLDDKPYGYGGVTENITLVARWRNKGEVKVEYDAGDGTNAPKDHYSYSSSSTVVVAGRPEPPTGYTFLGWRIAGDTKNVVYYPNGCFSIIPAYVNENNVVTLIAVYIPTGGNTGVTTSITYKPNGGQGSDVTIALPGDDPILVNQKVKALSAEDCGFTYEGYEFKGWSRTGGEDATVEIKAGDYIAADNKDTPNELYAVWECVMASYTVEYYKGVVTEPSDRKHYLGFAGPNTAKVGTVLTADDVDLNLYRPQVGYQEGQFFGSTKIVKGDNVIYVLYEPIPITVTINGIHTTHVYDGEEVTVTGFNVTVDPDSGYSADYIAYGEDPDTDETKVSATHVSETKEITLIQSKFRNTNPDFDDSAISFVLGNVTTNRVEITPATLTVTTPDASKVYDGTPLTAEGTISGFVKDETATFTTTGTITTPGEKENSYTLDWEGATARQTDYKITENLGTLTVTENTAAITVKTVGGEFVYDGTEKGATVEVTGLPKGYTLEKAESSAKATDVTENPVFATADTLIIRNVAGDDVTDKLTITKINDNITITPAPITIVTESGSKVYDGTPLTADGEMTGIVDGDEATLNITGSQTEVGSSLNTYTIDWAEGTKESNYKIVKETIGTLTVTEYAGEIVVTTTGGTFTYDGKAHGATVKVSELPTGYRLDTAASSATATDVTENPVTATADTLIIRNAADEDVTEKLKEHIKYVDGTIEVKPAKLTIVTPDAEKVYDGKPLTAEGNMTGLIDGETATFTTTGTQTEVGTSDNTYTIDWGTAKESNYVLDETIGTLEVKEFAGEIIVTTVGGEFEYDGKAHGAEVTVEGLAEGYEVQVKKSNATATNVTEENVPATCDELVIVNASGVDVTSRLQIKKKDGYIKITPAKLTVNIEGNKDSFKYNGQERTVEGYKIAPITNPLYKESNISFAGDAIAKGKTPGTYPMNLKAEQFTNSDKNFEVTFVIADGSLTIEPLGPDELFKIYATAFNAEREYTGVYYSGFEYELRGEGPTRNIIVEAAGKVLSFVREYIGGFKADAADGDKAHTVTINGTEFRVEGLYVPTKARNVGEYELPIEGEMKVYDGNVDVTDQFELVERNPGRLEITPMYINLTSGSASKVYDGTPLRNTNITADKNWGVGDTVRYDITGSQTAVGSSDNVFVAVGVDDTDLDTNYRINYKYGTLTVTSAPTPPAPTPTPGGTTITDAPTPTAPAPAPAPAPQAAVLGETREPEGAAVLGARRGRTEDSANTAGRIFAVLIAAAVATALMFARKKDEEEQE